MVFPTAPPVRWWLVVAAISATAPAIADEGSPSGPPAADAEQAARLDRVLASAASDERYARHLGGGLMIGLGATYGAIGGVMLGASASHVYVDEQRRTSDLMMGGIFVGIGAFALATSFLPFVIRGSAEELTERYRAYAAPPRVRLEFGERELDRLARQERGRRRWGLASSFGLAAFGTFALALGAFTGVAASNSPYRAEYSSLLTQAPFLLVIGMMGVFTNAFPGPLESANRAWRIGRGAE